MYSSFAIILIGVIGGGDRGNIPLGASFDDIAAVYKQTAASIPSLRVTFEVNGTSLKDYRDHYKGVVLRMKAKWDALPAAERPKHELAYKASLKRHEDKTRDPIKEYHDEITIERTPKGIEVRRMLPEGKEGLNPREDEARKRGIPSATGGRFFLYRVDKQAESLNWLAIDPYPLKGTTQPVYSTITGRLPLEAAFFPPLIDADGDCDTMLPGLERILFANPKIGEAHVAFPLTPAGLQYFVSLVDKKGSDVTVIAASVALTRGAIPDWMGQFKYSSLIPGNLDEARAKRFSDSVGSYRAQTKIVNPDYAYPTQLVWMENWQSLDGEVSYPRTFFLRQFVADTEKSDDGKDNLVILASHEFKLDIKSIERLSDSMIRTYPLAVPDGARSVDYAAGLSTVVGSASDNVDTMLGPQSDRVPRRQTSHLILIGVNAVALILLVVLWFRRRLGRNITASSHV